MSVECYAKVDLTNAKLLPKIYKGYFWLCHLRIIEVSIKSPNLMTTIGCIPGFNWEIVERCADVSWYEQNGGGFDWEDIPEVCEFLSQDDPEEATHATVLPFNHCIRRDMLVRKEELRHIFPECFSELATLDQILNGTVNNDMPTEILADYVRDRL